jgi:diketogulonate reductase-like aldo/keto reductase
MQKVILNNGVEMPIIGFGTYKLTDKEECEKCVLHALKCGYRHIDTAQFYKNEEFIGNAIKKSGIPREEIFITTKIWFSNFEENAYDSVIESLKKLQTPYVDLVLIHWPYGNYYNAYRALEKLYSEKKVRAIGVSNFNPDRFIDLIKFNKIVPQVNQLETNIYCQRQVEGEYLKKYGIAHVGYAPLGQGKREEMFTNPIILCLAEKYKKTPAQILLRHLVEKGITIIPKSANLSRIEENINIFDFKFTYYELELLNSLDKRQPIGGKPETPERTEQAMTWV